MKKWVENTGEGVILNRMVRKGHTKMTFKQHSGSES